MAASKETTSPDRESPAATPLDYRAFFESLPGLFLILRPDLTLVAANDAYLEATMTKRDEILGRNVFDVFPDNPDDPAAKGSQSVRASYARVLAQRTPDTMPLLKYDIARPDAEGGAFEERYWNLVNIPVLRNGEVVFIISQVRDVTESVRLSAEHEELARQNEQLAAIVETSFDAIVSTDLDGLVVSWNRGAENIFGYTAREKLGQQHSPFHDPERGAEELSRVRDAIEEDRSDHFETVRRRKDGREVDVAVTLSPVRGTAGKIIGVSEIVRDVTELHRIQKDLCRAKDAADTANRELESFSYSVAHDLRSPLRSLDGFSQALLEDYSSVLDDQGKDYLQRVRRGSQRMGQLIDDLLRLSRITRVGMQRRVVDLGQVAARIVGELRESEPSREVEVDVAGEMVVEGDPELLGVVLQNLIGNAWKFTSKEPAAKIEIGMSERDGRPACFVRDNGTGFDMAFADKLFGAFQRLHSEADFPGTGIGLATVRRIIHRHGGRVWAESEVGRGATFYFTLS